MTTLVSIFLILFIALSTIASAGTILASLFNHLLTSRIIWTQLIFRAALGHKILKVISVWMNCSLYQTRLPYVGIYMGCLFKVWSAWIPWTASPERNRTAHRMASYLFTSLVFVFSAKYSQSTDTPFVRFLFKA